MKPDISRTQIKKLQDVPNVGKTCVADLKLLGIERPEQLIGRVFISAVHFMEGEPALPWWHYTSERKRYLLASHAATKTEVE